MTMNALSRRRFLQCLGLTAGASLLSPLMSQLYANATGVMTRRVVIVVVGNGIETKSVTPELVRQAIIDAGARLSADQRVHWAHSYKHAEPLVLQGANLGQAQSLRGLRPSPGKLDLTDKAALVLGLSNTAAGGGHSSGYGALSAASARGPVPTAPTIDGWLSRQPSVRQATPFEAVRMGISDLRAEQQIGYGWSAYNARQPAPIILNIDAAYASLFGAVADPAGRLAFDKRTELLDFARVDVSKALQALPGSSTERAKLERYLLSIEELRERQDLLSSSMDQLSAVNPGGPSAASPPVNVDFPLDRLAYQFKLARAALMGQLTNVVLLGSGVGGDFDKLKFNSLDSIFRRDPDYRGVIDYHTLQHGTLSNPTFVEVVYENIARHVDMVADLARALAEVPEGDGTMLDHTVIMMMSDNGDFHHSQGKEWPVLLVGGQKLGLKTDGRAVVYPTTNQASHRQIANMFNTVGWAMGLELNSFGVGGATTEGGPLSELYG